MYLRCGHPAINPLELVPGGLSKININYQSRRYSSPRIWKANVPSSLFVNCVYELAMWADQKIQP